MRMKTCFPSYSISVPVSVSAPVSVSVSTIVESTFAQVLFLLVSAHKSPSCSSIVFCVLASVFEVLSIASGLEWLKMGRGSQVTPP